MIFRSGGLHEMYSSLRSVFHSLIDRPAARLVVLFIVAYRRWISPRKGYRCAHAVMTQGESCSDVGLRAFNSAATIPEAARMLQEQRRRCRDSYVQYRGLKGDAVRLLAVAPILADGDTIIKCC
jgi:hypothetical protein